MLSNKLLDIQEIMDSTTINALASNPWITLGGFFIGILGVVLAIVFYVKSKKDRLPCYEVSGNTLIEGVDKALDGLQLQYKGKQQNRITVTKIVLWNDGRETIDKNNIVPTDPVRVICPVDIDILDIQVTQVSSNANAIELCEPSKDGENTSYPINFEYLDHKDYLVIQIVHNGDETRKFSVKGKIKGVSDIARITNARVESKTMRYLRYLPLMPQVKAIMESRLFMKYVGAGSYLVFAGVGVWALIHGKTEWYVWGGTVFCILGAAVLYFGFRRIAPINI